MIRFVEISEPKAIAMIVKLSWQQDKEFFEKYMINPTREKSIADTIEKIMDALRTQVGIHFYDIRIDSGLSVGYQVLIKNGLGGLIFSFCINIKWRCRAVLGAFVRHYEYFFKDCKEIFCGIYAKNTRAADFFIKNGFHLSQKMHDENDKSGAEIVVLQKIRNGNINRSGNRPDSNGNKRGEPVGNG